MSTYSAQNINTPLKITEAAKLIGISRSTLMRLEEKGDITSVRLDNGYRVFYEKDLLNLKSIISEEKTKAKEAVKLTYQQNILQNKKDDQHEPVYQTPSNITNLIDSSHIKRDNFSTIIRTILNITTGLGFITLLLLFITLIKIVGNNSESITKNISNQLGMFYKNKIADNILAYKTAGKNLRYVFDIPILSKKNTFFDSNLYVKGDIKLENDLEVHGIANLYKGVYTPSINFTDEATISGLKYIDEQTENTLENTLGLKGDVVADNLNNTNIALGVIEGENLSDKFTYEGNFNLEGDFLLKGIKVDASAKDPNQIDDLAKEIGYLDDMSVDEGGILFGDGDGISQDTSNLFWDNVSNRLGVGNNNPSETLSVGDNGEFRVTSNGDVLLEDDTILDLSEITHATDNPQGLKLPQGISLSNMTGSGEGYLAYNTSLNSVMVYNGSTWQDVSSINPLQAVYEAGNTIQMSAAYGDIRIHNDSNNELLFLREGSGNVGIGNTNPSYKLDVTGGLSVTTFRLTNGAQPGYILTSNAQGDSTWTSPESYESQWTLVGGKLISQ